MASRTGVGEGHSARSGSRWAPKAGGLSWRVALLPYIEEETLYKGFKLDEPWDSPHNIKLLPRMPKMYKPARNYREPFTTYFQVITGSGGLLRNNRAPRLPKDFISGTSNVSRRCGNTRVK